MGNLTKLWDKVLRDLAGDQASAHARRLCSQPTRSCAERSDRRASPVLRAQSTGSRQWIHRLMIETGQKEQWGRQARPTPLRHAACFVRGRGTRVCGRGAASAEPPPPRARAQELQRMRREYVQELRAYSGHQTAYRLKVPSPLFFTTQRTQRGATSTPGLDRNAPPQERSEKAALCVLSKRSDTPL